MIDPDDDTPVIYVKNNKDEDVFAVQNNGSIVATGKLYVNDVSFMKKDNQDVTGLSDVALSGKYTDLIGGTSSDKGKSLIFDGNGKIVSQNVAAGNVTGLADVATSGSYNDLSDKPTLFSGSYNDLSNKPTLFSGNYNDLSDKPKLKTIATSGKYTDLIVNKSDAGKLLYVDEDGNVTAISIAVLKEKLS